MATFLYRLGLGSYRHRVAVVGVWLVLLVAAGLGAATLSGKTVDTFRIPGQESTTALDILGQKFGSGANGATAQVVLAAPAGQTVTSGPAAAAVATTVARLQRLNGVVSATDPLDPKAPAVSVDKRAAYSTVTYGVQPPEITYTQRAALIGTVQAARDAGLTAEVAGQASVPPTKVGGAAELVGVAAALVVLLLTYGSVVAAGMNLVTAIVGVAIGALGITTLTGFVDLQSTTPILALMLGLAVGIDYALFIFTRFRQELMRGRDVGDAVGTAVGTAGSAVLTAGITVVAAAAGARVLGRLGAPRHDPPLAQPGRRGGRARRARDPGRVDAHHAGATGRGRNDAGPGRPDPVRAVRPRGDRAAGRAGRRSGRGRACGHGEPAGAQPAGRGRGDPAATEPGRHRRAGHRDPQLGAGQRGDGRARAHAAGPVPR
jgi:hypothetical protein